jgi:hypothetical protein
MSADCLSRIEIRRNTSATNEHFKITGMRDEGQGLNLGFRITTLKETAPAGMMSSMPSALGVVPSPPNVTGIETNGLAVRTERIAAYRGLAIGVLAPVDEHSRDYEHKRDFSTRTEPAASAARGSAEASRHSG